MFFSLREDKSQLIIRAKKGVEILELIPHTIFEEDLPEILVNDYAHWLEPSTRVVELRPLTQLWAPSHQNWRIHVPQDEHATMRKGHSYLLIDIRSDTFRMISARLSALEYAPHLTATYCENDRSLLVDLPRLRLSFFLNTDGILESQNLPGMVIDSNQSTGTMFGLSNQLVLRARNPSSEPSQRCRRVLIPYGDTKLNGIVDDHINVTLDTSSKQLVHCYEYNIDNVLGRLTGTVSLASRLYKIYLHALTSHCLPDPLTGKTGTEEALEGLQSAAVMSFERWGELEREILNKIWTLTPEREFEYGGQYMMKMRWSGLPALSQHHDFAVFALAIDRHAKRLEIFDPPQRNRSQNRTTAIQNIAPRQARGTSKREILFTGVLGAFCDWLRRYSAPLQT